MKTVSPEYRSAIKPVWCPGCGDYGVLKSLLKALTRLEIPPEEIVAVSGIGCAGRLSHYLNAYSVHGTHGRAVPLALGVKAAAPELTVIAVGGDGDGLGIGGGHIPHAARKNVDITYLLIDNRVYGMTKGQPSPTTPIATQTKASPFGVSDEPLSAIPIFLAYDASFVARGESTNPRQLTELLCQAIAHKGMSIVQVLSTCQTFPVLNTKQLRTVFEVLPAGHDRTDKLEAFKLAYSREPLYTGVFYQVARPTLADHLQSTIQHAYGTQGGAPLALSRVLRHFA